MSVYNLFSNNGVLWSIRANDISGNYSQKIDLSTINTIKLLTSGVSRAEFNNLGLVLQSGGNTITTQQSSNLILDASNSVISLRTSGVERLALNNTSIDVPNAPSVNDVSLHLNTILKIYDSSLAAKTNAIGLYSTGSSQYFLRHFGSSTTSIFNMGISSTNANEMIDLISILPRSTLRLYSPTVDISGNTNFRNIPTCSVAASSSNDLVNKTYVDSTFSRNTTLTTNVGVNISGGAWSTIYNFGTLSTGTYIFNYMGYFEYAISGTSTAGCRLYNATTGIDITGYNQRTNLNGTSTYSAIGGSHIFVLGSSANVIFQGYSAASGTTLVYTNLGYQKII